MNINDISTATDKKERERREEEKKKIKTKKRRRSGEDKREERRPLCEGAARPTLKTLAPLARWLAGFVALAPAFPCFFLHGSSGQGRWRVDSPSSGPLGEESLVCLDGALVGQTGSSLVKPER